MTGARVPRVLHLTWRLSVGGGIQAVIRALVTQASSDFELHVATVTPDGQDGTGGPFLRPNGASSRPRSSRRPEDVAGLPTPSNVEVMGYVDVDTYRNLLGRARLSVIASHERAHPSGQTVLLESMAMGRTTVVTDTSALRDYVEPGVTALTVPTGDPVRLAEIMTTAFDDPALREGLGGAARHAVERTFNARRMWDDIGEIIDEVAH